MNENAESPSGREIYAEYIREQLEGQEARKVSLEQRGISVVSTSGALVTLLFGLTALTVERQGFELPTSARVLLVGSLVFFLLAGLSAIVTNIPLSYEGVTTDALREIVHSRWSDEDALAAEMTSLTRIKVLESAKRKNNLKGIALFAGMVSEIIGVALVVGAVAIVLAQ